MPHFQDTYGWILHRRGDSEGAVAVLEPAAAALPDNALVQFHLGEALFALDRPAEARARFARALELEPGGPEAATPQAEAARARLAEIDAAPAPLEAAEGPGAGRLTSAAEGARLTVSTCRNCIKSQTPLGWRPVE